MATLTLQPFKVLFSPAFVAPGSVDLFTRRGAAADRKTTEKQDGTTAQAFLMRLAAEASRSVICCVLRLANNFKVFNSIVGLVPVLVVNDFLREGKQFTSKMGLHNKPMFALKLAIDKLKSITPSVRTSRPVVRTLRE